MELERRWISPGCALVYSSASTPSPSSTSVRVEYSSRANMYSASAGSDTLKIIQNFIKSFPGSSQSGARQEETFTTLEDLLSPSNTVAIVDTASTSQIDGLLSLLPHEILLTAHEQADRMETDSNQSTTKAAVEALSPGMKKDILRRVLRSPQLHQSLASLTFALRDGGLPTVAEALHINLHNRGYIENGTMPLGGPQAVRAFVEGVRKSVAEDNDGALDK